MHTLQRPNCPIGLPRPASERYDSQSQAAETAREIGRLGDVWVLDLSQAADAGPEVCGGKGFNLGRLHSYGFPVPSSLLVTASAYRRHTDTPAIAELMGKAARLSAQDAYYDRSGERLLCELREAIEAGTLPALLEDQLATSLAQKSLTSVPLAVRSSATAEDGAEHSFAGIHASFLGIVGLEAVCRAIRSCYASLWTPWAVAYRRLQEVSDAQVACAVVVCAMIQRPDGRPLPAGVAFSCDPRTGRRDRVVLNAALGPGAMVSGNVTPEAIVVQVTPRALSLAARSSPADVILTDSQALELARLALRVQGAMDDGQVPQDIEWAHDGRQWWLLQARPVTRLPRPTCRALAGQPVIWSNANLVDSLPGVVSTLGWSMVRVVLWPLLFATVEAVGPALPAGIDPVRRFSGRAYFDLSCLQWAYFDALGILPAETNRALGGHQPEIAVPANRPFRGPRGRARLMANVRILWLVLKLPRTFRRDLAAIHTFARGRMRGDLAQQSNAELLAAVNEAADRLIAFSARCELTDTGGLWQRLLEDLLVWRIPARGRAVAAGLMAGSGAVTSAEHGYRLAELAALAQDDPAARSYLTSAQRDPEGWRRLPPASPFAAECARFLADFGHRGVYEADIANPRWSDDPTYLFEQMRLRVESGKLDAPRDRGRAVRAAAEAELAALPCWLRPLVSWLAARARGMAALREAGKSALVAPLQPLRAIALEVGRRLVSSGAIDQPADVFQLSREDVEAVLRGEWDGSGARELAAARQARDALWSAEAPPGVIVVDPADRRAGDAAAVRAAGPAALSGRIGTRLQGMGIAAGRASGPARILRHPGEGHRLRSGEILIAPSTDPGWTPLFLRAAAVVAEVGGYLSHGAIVAREYGLPAVSNIPGLLGAVHDGCRLAVDGDSGEVVIENG